MIVIGVLVMMMGISVSSISDMSSTQLRTQTNRLSAALRFTYNRAVSHGLYMRMVIDIDSDSYWVEASEEPIFLAQEKRQEGEEEEPEERDDEEEGKRNIRKTLQEDGVIKRVKMEKGIGVDGVHTSGQDDIFQSGRAYIHFFPNGFVEPAIIYTTDNDNSYYTLQLSPLTGRVRRKYGKVDPDRDFGEPDQIEEESP